MKFLTILLLSVVVIQAEESALQDFINANNQFAATVYKEIKTGNNDNFLVSPYSAETVLALTHSGCNGDTAKELRTALRLPEEKDQIEAGVKASLPLLKGNDLYTLHTANKIYVKDGFTIKDNFNKIATEIFDGDVELINFERNVEAAETINKWVEDKTKNKIQNLVDSNVLNKLTRAVLINTLYFRGNWSVPFEDYITRQQKFYKSSKDVIQVDMMHQYEECYNYYESADLNAQFLELPFEGGDVSMIIALPNEKEGLSALENQIDKVLTAHSFQNTLVNVNLPKFKVESTIKLKEILKHLGVDKMFDADKGADLSGIAGEPGDIEVKEVLQKTFIDVEEQGVEAAAATYVAAGVPLSAAVHSLEPKDFIVDHPFIFYIKAKGFVIFAGRVLSPRH